MRRISQGSRSAKTILVIVSSLLTLATATVVYEVWKSKQYDRWRTYYQKKGDWKGRLTVESDNQILMWEYRPNSQYTAPKDRYTITTNRYGFRGKDRDLSRRKDSKRVAFLGDSATLGLFVDEEDTFVSKFEHYANSGHRNTSVESFNCAIDGYHSLQLLELLKIKVVNLQPDTVVYVMHLNDFDFEYSSSNKILYFKRPDSFVWNDIRNIIWPIFYDYYDYSFKKNKNAVFEAVKEMSHLLREKEIDFVVAILPVFMVKEENFVRYPHWKIHHAIGNFLSGEGIPSIDLATRFKEEKQPPKFFARDVWHLNRSGHDFVARELLPVVLTDEQ